MIVRTLAGARRALPRLGSVAQQRELASMEPVKYLIVGNPSLSASGLGAKARTSLGDLPLWHVAPSWCTCTNLTWFSALTLCESEYS